MRPGDAQYALAGVVAAVVGFASAATVVLAGLESVGASEAEAASGLLAVSVAMGALSVLLSTRTRIPVAIAWSTPGAALLIMAGVPEGGWPAVVGAFLVAAALTVLAGCWKPLERAIRAIPPPLAAALLAGVLLPLCLTPAQAVVDVPELALPVVFAWAALFVLNRRWAVPGALVAALGALAVDGSLPGPGDDLLPTLALTAPELSSAALVSIALPLFVVTMASQNVPGAAVLASFGYRPDLRRALVATGAGSALAAPLGGHGVNLAAITAALVAGPEAGPDPGRRWVAAVGNGVASIVLGLFAGVFAAVIAAAPAILVQAVAGLALLGALTSGLTAALADPHEREAAVVVLVVTASGISVGGVTAPFWGLLAGLALRFALRRRRPAPGVSA